ncbi:MAG TPA: outer membrane beta-barrel protein [Acidobacteriaceae bacterium]|nr:outer membrane beta-barrel protein [Acidobacteriaceae bacterium]
MKKTCLPLLALSLFTLLPSAMHAQATPAATRGGASQVGVGYSVANEDEYPGKHVQGMTFYGTFDLNNHLGVEGDIHMDSLFRSYFGYTESSYDVGLRWVEHYRRFHPYAKGMIGLGHSYAPFVKQIVGGSTPGTYMLFAVGGGVDYSLNDKFNIRAFDFEYQRWPNFPPHGLTPPIMSFGVAYRLR